MATPDWNDSANTISTFGRKGRVVTPAAVDLDPIAKAVVMLAAGNITIIPRDNANGAPITFNDVPAGFIPPYQVRRVTACTSSCATID
ncbi:MAG: hypothetical protein ABS75_07265 [Pelagibacterium sp. SCN 63-23]|nr:MAG: hypothetical protein ABS75_07265 [Pelagibacterium sp. SCN 63-23]